MAIYLRKDRNLYFTATSYRGQRNGPWRPVDLKPVSSAFRMLCDKEYGTTYHSDDEWMTVPNIITDYGNLSNDRLAFEASAYWNHHTGPYKSDPFDRLLKAEPLPRTVQALTDIVADLQSKADKAKEALDNAKDAAEVAEELLKEAIADLEVVQKRRKPKFKAGPVKSGRFASKSPNISNLPKKG